MHYRYSKYSNLVPLCITCHEKMVSLMCIPCSLCSECGKQRRHCKCMANVLPYLVISTAANAVTSLSTFNYREM